MYFNLDNGQLNAVNTDQSKTVFEISKSKESNIADKIANPTDAVQLKRTDSDEPPQKTKCDPPPPQTTNCDPPQKPFVFGAEEYTDDVMNVLDRQAIMTQGGQFTQVLMNVLHKGLIQVV